MTRRLAALAAGTALLLCLSVENAAAKRYHSNISGATLDDDGHSFSLRSNTKKASFVSNRAKHRSHPRFRGHRRDTTPSGTIRERWPRNDRTNLELHRRGFSIVRVSTVAGPIEVDPRFKDKFIGLILDFKMHGYVPKNVTCQAFGHKPGSNHAGGGACDFHQRAWGKTDKFMYSKTAEELIRKHGLYSGSKYGDWGHVEAMRGLYNYSRRPRYVRHHRMRYASGAPMFHPSYVSSR